jgi:co-chaperonin GroES (HSP10)
MKAIGKYIVITPIVEELKTSSGLLLTDEDALRYKKGVVVEPGSLVDTIVSGDKIYYDKNAGHKIMVGNDVYMIILERDVVVVL